MRRSGRRLAGQSLVEFALTLPLFTLFVLCVIQLSLLFLAFYSETRMARETARWLAVRSSSTTDDLVAAHVQSTMLPGLIGGTPGPNQGTSTDAKYAVGKMTVQFTACGSSTAPCTNTARSAGSVLYVQLSYDASNLVFLPTTFRLGGLSVGVPTGIPPYKVSVMVE